MKNKTRFVPGFLLGMLAMLVVVAGIGIGIYFSDIGVSTSKDTNAVSRAEKKLKALEEVIDTYYLEDTDKENLEEGLYKGLFAGIGDPYSVYYTKKEYDELQESTSGKYYGIGALVSQNIKTSIVTISKVFKDAPADKAGMKSGDAIYKVDDQDISGKDVDEVVS